MKLKLIKIGRQTMKLWFIFNYAILKEQLPFKYTYFAHTSFDSWCIENSNTS